MNGCKLLALDLLIYYAGRSSPWHVINAPSIGNLSFSSRVIPADSIISPRSCHVLNDWEYILCSLGCSFPLIQARKQAFSRCFRRRGGLAGEVLVNAILTAISYRQKPARIVHDPFFHCPSLARRCKTGTELGGTMPSSVTIIVI